MTIKHLWVVMPVYNEEEAITTVIEEWISTLDNTQVHYTFCVLNDGSKDKTLPILNELSGKYNQLKIVNKQNSGHGQTCIEGYKMGLENGADWIFQIDSDGQCDPQYFSEFLKKAREGHLAVYGKRVKRDDGLQRVLVSKFVKCFVLVATGTWVVDSNVPYRLIHRDIMTSIPPRVPNDFHLANILVAVLCQRQCKIFWVPIRFRDRTGGSPSVKTFSFIKHGLKLFKQLRAAIQ